MIKWRARDDVCSIVGWFSCAHLKDSVGSSSKEGAISSIQGIRRLGDRGRMFSRRSKIGVIAALAEMLPISCM